MFWIVDNGSSHRANASSKRLQNAWPKLILVHTPVDASWLNQIEIIFSILQRKVLSPNDFASLQAVVDRLDAFEKHYNQIARPISWKFTRQDLAALLVRMARHEPQLSLAAQSPTNFRP